MTYCPLSTNFGRQRSLLKTETNHPILHLPVLFPIYPILETTSPAVSQTFLKFVPYACLGKISVQGVLLAVQLIDLFVKLSEKVLFVGTACLNGAGIFTAVSLRSRLHSLDIPCSTVSDLLSDGLTKSPNHYIVLPYPQLSSMSDKVEETLRKSTPAAPTRRTFERCLP